MNALRASLRVLLAAPLLLASPAPAQDVPAWQPSFPRLFPSPTGPNGYEDLVMAADLAHVVERNHLPEQGETLSDVRRAVASPEWRRARALLTSGLTKPVRSPRQRVSFSTEFPELAGMRSVARVLAREIRVRFADGRVAEAIASLRDGLRMATLIQGETLIGGLVGVACSAIVLKEFRSHIGQLAVQDCERTLSVVREWLRLPDGEVPAVLAERDTMIRQLLDARADPAEAGKVARAFLGDEELERDPDEQPELVRRLLSDPVARAAALDEAVRKLEAHYARVLEGLRKPFWQRRPVELEPDGSLSGKLCETLVPVLSKVGEKYAFLRADVQHLGVEAAIRRFVWERDRAPGSLGDLDLGEMAISPVTGEPFAYQRTGERTYELPLPRPAGP